MSSTEYRESEPFTQVAMGPLAAWKRHWVMGVAVALIGAVIGVAVGFVIPVSYTAEARVAVGSGDLSAGAVAGFPLAASDLASNYARYVNDRGVANTDVPDGVTLSASQIPESNVIRSEAVASDSAAAVSAANSMSAQLVKAVNTGDKQSVDQVFTAFTEAAKDDAAKQTQLAAAQHDLDVLLNKNGATKQAVQAARDQLTKATANASNSSTKAAALRQKYTNLVDGDNAEANLQSIRTAVGATSNRMSRVSQLGLLGLIAGAAVGLVIAFGIERRNAATAPPANEKATGRTGE